MRRRITFIQRPEAPFALDQAVLTPDALSIRNLDALREERFTFSFDELTTELWGVLKQCQQVHIRWATERAYDTSTPAPFSSKISPGLHVFFTPSGGAVGSGDGTKEALLCSWLKRVFGDEVDCSSAASFTSPPVLSKRFSSTSDLHYHTLLASPDNLVTFIQQSLCTRGAAVEKCQSSAASLLSGDSIDISYDGIANAMTMSAVWNAAPQNANGWTDRIEKPEKKTDQIEVGLLGSQSAAEPEDIKMGGLLGVIGKDEELKPAMFSFPARHHPLPDDATYTVSFPHPTGLHPTLTLSLSRSSLQHPPAPPDTTCALHTYLTLPSSIFGDKYQLSMTDPLFLQSHNLLALRAVFGETDLEAPDWSVDPWGSNWLFELASPTESELESDGKAPDEWNVTIPLHLRYLRPSESGYRTAEMPWPIVFWACTAEEGSKMGVNPFDRVNLGWEGLFGPRTMFYQLHPSRSSSGGGRLIEKLDVPVLQFNEDEGIFFNSRMIELCTVAVIVLGFAWVLWKLGLVVRSSTAKSKQGKAEGKTE